MDQVMLDGRTATLAVVRRIVDAGNTLVWGLLGNVDKSPEAYMKLTPEEQSALVALVTEWEQALHRLRGAALTGFYTNAGPRVFALPQESEQRPGDTYDHQGRCGALHGPLPAASPTCHHRQPAGAGGQ
jgi:hypothetical protein